MGIPAKVEPIRTEQEIRQIIDTVASNKRNLALFIVGINTNFRASDLLKIKVGDVKYLTPGDCFRTTEKKTGKERYTTLNEAAVEAIQSLLTNMPETKDIEPLFQSRKSAGQISVSTFSTMVKSWCEKAGLKGNYGSHSLRKTFGYVHRTVFGTDIPTLMDMFNHSTQRQTLAYLGVQAAEVKAAYMKNIGKIPK